MRNLKIKIIISIIVLYFFWPSFGLVAAPLPIYISQVQTTGGKNNTSEDFVELFNPNASPVNLKGYRLVKRSAGANSDTLMKSWSKDSFIPAKSFYLWANTGYVNIGAKPDVTSSATIADDNGVALRLGANDTGVIVDSVAWGKSNSIFNNVTLVNPGAGQAVFRKDFEAVQSAYYIGKSLPHNSTQNDLAAAYGQSQTSQATVPAKNITSPKASPTPVSTTTKENVASSTPPIGDTEVLEPVSSSATVTPTSNIPINKSSGTKFLILSGAAFLTLIVIGYLSINKNK